MRGLMVREAVPVRPLLCFIRLNHGSVMNDVLLLWLELHGHAINCDWRPQRSDRARVAGKVQALWGWVHHGLWAVGAFLDEVATRQISSFIHRILLVGRRGYYYHLVGIMDLIEDIKLFPTLLKLLLLLICLCVWDVLLIVPLHLFIFLFHLCWLVISIRTRMSFLVTVQRFEHIRCLCHFRVINRLRHYLLRLVDGYMRRSGRLDRFSSHRNLTDWNFMPARVLFEH